MQSGWVAASGAMGREIGGAVAAELPNISPSLSHEGEPLGPKKQANQDEGNENSLPCWQWRWHPTAFFLAKTLLNGWGINGIFLESKMASTSNSSWSLRKTKGVEKILLSALAGFSNETWKEVGTLMEGRHFRQTDLSDDWKFQWASFWQWTLRQIWQVCSHAKSPLWQLDCGWYSMWKGYIGQLLHENRRPFKSKTWTKIFGMKGCFLECHNAWWLVL